jgi:hypothetical protein
MKHILDKVSIVVRQCNTKGMSLTAKACKDQATLNTMLHKDVGFKFLKKDQSNEEISFMSWH